MPKKKTKKVKTRAPKKVKKLARVPKASKKDTGYEAKHITVLEGLKPVRKRPAMYIGSTGPEGLHHLLWEVIDNGIDEAMAGFCNQIKVTLLPGHKARVEDNGRGIPVDIHKQTKKSALETVMTTLHAGGKFEHQAYKVSGGLHGVGVSVVNALSVWMKAEVKRDGKLYVQEYKRGKALRKVKAQGKTRGTGTIVTFEPDPEIFSVLDFDWQTILNHLRQQAYLTKGVKIIVEDKRGGENQPYTFYFEGGIVSYVRHLNHHKEVKHPTPFYIDKEYEKMQVEVAFQYVNDYKENLFTFANNINTVEGGTHLVGFRTALTRALNSYARKQEYLTEKDEKLGGEDVREGLTAVVSVKVREPQFEGQTKAKLGNVEVRSAVDTVVSDALQSFLEEHPHEAQEIINKCVLAAKARAAAKSARESVLRKGALEGLTLPGKLADCTSRNPEECELYIVEGDSAGGSAKQGRNRNFQAILPLRGKILNVEKARIDKMLNNNEIRSLIIALGTNIGEQFKMADLRYNRVIIMTDADVDGAHIRTLLLTLFYRYFPELVTQGHLYIAQPPLYRISRGNEIKYAYTEGEKEKILKELVGEKKEKSRKKVRKSKKVEVAEEEVKEDEEEKISGVSIQRYKGLGEMNPGQLWETTMNPENRIMKRVTIQEAEEADEIFDILMGTEVDPRKKFLSVHAKNVKNLDI